MPEVTRHELHPADGGGLTPVLFGSVLPTEGNGVIGDVDQARIVDGGACDVSAQVFEGAATGTRRLNVYAPVLVPDDGIDLPVVLFQQLIKVLAEGGSQMFEENQVFGIFHAHQLTSRIQAHARYETMDVRMKSQLLVPGVEHGGEAVNGGAQAFVGRKLFAERTRHGGEKDVVSLLCMQSEKGTAQFRGQREGDEEVRGVDEFALFALNPLGVVSAAAERAGLVIAGMKSKVLASARLAIKESPAQRRGAAMSDGPEGAVLRG